jgi:hypothetical protein
MDRYEVTITLKVTTTALGATREDAMRGAKASIMDHISRAGLGDSGVRVEAVRGRKSKDQTCIGQEAMRWAKGGTR